MAEDAVVRHSSDHAGGSGEYQFQKDNFMKGRGSICETGSYLGR